jgi:hypothetical protein
MPATINPAGKKISAAPILVNSINEIISKLANVVRLNKDLMLAGRFFNLDSNFDISPTVAHSVLNCIKRQIKYDNKLESGSGVPSAEDAAFLPRRAVNKSESFFADQLH